MSFKLSVIKDTTRAERLKWQIKKLKLVMIETSSENCWDKFTSNSSSM
jgi:hypothetical protein